MNQAKKKPSNSKLARVIAVNLFLIVFCLAGAFGGTIAWFNSSVNQEATVSTFQVIAPPSLNFDIYYLRSFGSGQQEKDGNYNLTTHLFSGYQNDLDNPNFVEVQDNDGSTNIEHLWPAHKMTYALVIDSDPISGFTLDSWIEDTTVGKARVLETIEQEEVATRISLTWAINMYAGIWTVTKANPENVASDIASAYVSYKAAQKTDVFRYKQTPGEGDNPPAPISFEISSDAPTSLQRTILFFTIEFSNDSSTFYEYIESDANYDYFEKNIVGNSNCYEGLRFTSLAFGLN